MYKQQVACSIHTNALRAALISDNVQLGAECRAVEHVFPNAVQVHLHQRAHGGVEGGAQLSRAHIELRAKLLHDSGVGAAPAAKGQGKASWFLL